MTWVIGVAVDTGVRILRQPKFGGLAALTLCRQVGHEPVRERPDRLVLVIAPLGRLRRAVDDDASGAEAVDLDPAVRIAAGLSVPVVRLRLVLRPDEAAFDAKPAIGVEHDEGADARHLGGIMDVRAVVQGIELGAELLDLLVVVRSLRIFGIEFVVFGLQCIMLGQLLPRHLGGLAIDAAQAGGVAIGKVDGRLHPLPALALQGFGIGLQLREHELFEQRRILEPAAAILLEQIAQDDAAGLLIGFGADIDGARRSSARTAVSVSSRRM